MLLDTIKQSFRREPSPDDEARLRLRITDGCILDVCPPSDQRTIYHAELPVLIGRDPLARVLLKDRSVSRYHCEISQIGDEIVIRDLESTNGTMVNGEKVNVYALYPGDVVSGAKRQLSVNTFAIHRLRSAKNDGRSIMVDTKVIVLVGTLGSHPILSTPTIIGRSREASIRIGSVLTSREHCEIDEETGRLIVRDLKSMNGTFLNGQRINEAKLAVGDVLQVGGYVLRVDEQALEDIDWESVSVCADA